MDDNSTNDRRAPKPEDITLEIADWIAECLSLHPDHTLAVRNVGSSWDALCLIYLISHIASQFWITDEILRKIAQKAYLSNYEGEWENVQFILEQNPQTPREFYELFLKSHSPEEFFGNLRKRSMRIILLIRKKKRDPHGPVARSQRVRGYKDKGTYHPPHEFHGIPPEKEPRVDRRKKVGHPLLLEEDEEPGG